MTEAVLFAIVFVGFFVLRGIAATIFFVVLLNDDGRCPNCDAETLRVQSRAWEVTMPWLRASWCPRCGWEGMLRRRAHPKSTPPSHGVRTPPGREAPRP
jgi:hypothetical protein